LIVAGSRGMSGAAILSGRAALRSGAGLVTVATPASCADLVAAGEPCYTTHALPLDDHQRLTPMAVEQLAAREADAWACGPGLGQTPDVADLVAWIYASRPSPMVVDADALNVLAARRVDLAVAAGPRILTPHPGEFRRLTEQNELDNLALRELAVSWAKERRLIVVLKGHRSLITDGTRCYINDTGNPGMATGGTGDVLTGVITALLGQGLAGFEAAQLGVYVHGLAGDLTAKRLGQVGMIASDLVDDLPRAFLAYAESSSAQANVTTGT
jgi:NAD(P)H-hydrate epimerase